MSVTIIWGADSGADIKLPFAGNCALVGTRIVGTGSGDVALAFNEFIPDEHTVALYHMNEAAWTGAEGEVVDSSGNGYHGAARNGATTTSGWFDRCGEFGDSQYCNVPALDVLIEPPLTTEVWIYWRSRGLYLHHDIVRKLYNIQWGVQDVGEENGKVYLDFYSDVARYSYRTSEAIISPETWGHLAVVIADYEDVSLYLNGNSVDFAFLGVASNTFYYSPLRISSGESWGGYLDELRISSTVRYTSDFSPHRYEPGTVTARYQVGSPQRITAVDWGGLLGADYGVVTKVEVNTTSGWRVVAEDPAGLTPPLTNLSYITAGPDIVRVTLAPRADTLQSETPVLDWLKVAFEPVGLPPALRASLLPRRLTASLQPRRLKAEQIGKRFIVTSADE